MNMIGMVIFDLLLNLELDEYYEEELMISNTTVVPHVEKWETVSLLPSKYICELALNNFIQGILVLKIIDHLTMAFFTTGVAW